MKENAIIAFLGGRGENFICLPRRGESSKLKKAGGSMVEGWVFLKGVGDTFSD